MALGFIYRCCKCNISFFAEVNGQEKVCPSCGSLYFKATSEQSFDPNSKHKS